MQKDDIMFGKIGNISETSTETHALESRDKRSNQ